MVFLKTFCDTGSGVNVISKVAYNYLFGDEPLYLTYIQLQMADLSTRFPEGIVKNIAVNIKYYYIRVDFLVLDM